MNETDLALKPNPFPSPTALRVEHIRLMELYEVAERTPDLPLSDELLADIQNLLARAKATGAKLSLAADRSDAQSVLTYWTSVLRNKGVTTKTTLLARFDKDQAIERLAGKSPYKGLAAFQSDDGELFFGRREVITEMLRVLRARRLLTVLGISGCGKSSTVRAGVLPALQDDAIPGSKDWLCIPPFMPGADPLGSLVNVLRPPGVDAEVWNQETLVNLRTDPKTLERLLDQRGKPVVMAIDQLEEAFTLSLGESDRDAFFANLSNLIKSQGSRHSLILTMRSEFDALLSQTTLAPFLAESRVRLPSLQPAELRDAIERPAQRFGVRIDPAVVQSLIKNVLNEPAGLPLLEFALMKLWQKRDQDLISKESYDELGGTPQQILVKAANDSLAAFNLAEDQERCRLLFLRLVRTGDSLEVTSRRRRLEELKFIGAEHVDRLLARLEPDGLVRVTPVDPRDQSSVELSHESLTRNWPQLVDWVRSDLAKLRRRELLEETVDQWQKSPQTVTPYAGGQLTEALEFPDLSNAEREFLAHGKTESRRKMIALYGAIALLSGLLLLSGFLTYAAWTQNQQLQQANKELKEAQQESIKAATQTSDALMQLQVTSDALISSHLKGTLPAAAQQALQTDKVIIYLQIPDEKHRDLAHKMIRALKKFNSAAILPGIQRLDPSKVNFPKGIQLRYFRKENAGMAKDMIDHALTGLGQVAPTLVGPEALGQDRINALPPYLFEIWIGTDANPTPNPPTAAKAAALPLVPRSRG